MNALTTTQNEFAIMPVMAMDQALARYQAVIDFTKAIMKQGTDYGTIPGTGDKPTLLKPGAEKLSSFFGLSPRFETAEKIADWTGADHDGEPFFYFQYRCDLYRGDMLVGSGLGSCNSWEKKYRYRTADLSCPVCGKSAIKRSKYPPRNNPTAQPGWYCFGKIGGCGANFNHDDPAIVNQSQGDVKNPNPADLVNTIDKMAQKRALVAATLIATNASEYFTQDIEDIYDGNWSDMVAPPSEKQQPAAAPVETSRNMNDLWPAYDYAFAIGQRVMVQGKDAQKPGTVTDQSDDGKYQVQIDNNGTYWLSEDKLSELADDEPADDDLLDTKRKEFFAVGNEYGAFIGEKFGNIRKEMVETLTGKTSTKDMSYSEFDKCIDWMREQMAGQPALIDDEPAPEYS